MITIEQLTRWRNNPIRGLNYVIDETEKNWFNKAVQINSATHPAVWCADLTIGNNYVFLTALDDAISKVFKPHARNISELSRNMNTIDYYGLFGNPAPTKVKFVMPLANLIALAPIATSTVNGVNLSYQKMVIPKDTQIDVSGYSFMVENGIEIRYNERTGVQTVYDPTSNNPFNAIAENVLKRELKPINGQQYLIIDVPVRQLACELIDNISSTTASGGNGYSATYTDYLYGVRAYLTNTAGVKKEIEVTYDQDVFDPGTVTLTVDLDTTSNSFKFGIPDIYIENGLGVGTLQVCVYTTKGVMNKDFRDIDIGDYRQSYRDFSTINNVLGPYSSFIMNMGGVFWKFEEIINGGTIPNSFSKIKYNVVNGRRLQARPITENNLIGSVEEFGYSAIKTIDYVSSRLFALTKELPLQENKDFYSGVNCYVGTNLITAKGLVATGVVHDNGERITIPSKTLVDITNPTTVILNSLEVQRLNQLSNNALIAELETRTLSYFPFHYVMDMTNDQASIRMYNLDNPTFGVQSFQDENVNLGIELGVDVATIVYEQGGYSIYVQTSSGDSFKNLTNQQVGVQLSVELANSTQLASVRGELVYLTADQERVYRFRLETNFDITSSNALIVNNMNQYGATQPFTPIPLATTFSFIFTRSVGNWVNVIAADDEIDRSLFDTPMQAIIKTNLDVTLGKELNRLYNRVRPLVGEGQYRRYESDVPQVYANDVLKRVDGKLVFDDEGNVVIEHRKGEPVLTADGQPIYEHLKGDYVKDDNDRFVLLAPRELSYHWDFVSFDAVYHFSKDDYDKQFAEEVKNYLTGAITTDLDLYMDMVIDQTRLVFQPKSKLSWKKVIINNNNETTVKQDLSFEVTYYLTKAGDNNTNLKTSLKTNTPKVLNNFLFTNSTIGISKITKALMENVPADVVDVKINAISGARQVDVISSVDALSGFSIRKRLVLGDNKQPAIAEDVKVDFLRHDASNMN